MLINNSEYFETLEDIKARIKAAQYKAILGANREQILLNWNIGKTIISKSQWGNKFIDNLARDIKLEFPGIKGYSTRNLKYMRKFAEFIDDLEIVQRVSALFSWSHNTTLMDKTKSLAEYLWYADEIIQYSLSLSKLEYRIETKTYQRQVTLDKATNYQERLPAPQNELVQDTLKSPFVFDFIENREDIIEREIENEMVANIAKTILELGTGFAFCGHQYYIEVEGIEYRLDLLFFNTELSCYVVIELKNTPFRPEYAGRLNFYLSAVDDILNRGRYNPTIGIILCKERKRLTAEYALRDINKPIGVSEYRLSDFIPAELVDTLPSAEDIEKRIKAKYEIEDDDVNPIR